MSNFNFIPIQWKKLTEAPRGAEKHVKRILPNFC